MAKADLAQEVAASRLIALATSASQPILQGEWLRPGTHINAVGSFRPDLREFDRATVERAELWVDLREAAEEEAGELIEAAKAGVLQWSRCRELGELLDEPSSAPTQSNSDRITLFKSVGHAAQDLYAALAISRLRNANDSAGP